MATWMPPIDPALMQAAMRRMSPAAGKGAPAPASAPIAPGVAAGAGLSNAARAASGQQPPVTPAQPAPTVSPSGAPPVSSAPKPTDDPSLLTQAQPFQKAVNDASTALQTEQDKVNQIKFPTPPNYQQDFQPKGWRKVLGTALGYIPLMPTQLASAELMHVPQYNRAVNEYGRQRESAMDQLASEREIGVPLANDRARIAQEGFQNWFNLQKENREEKTAQSNAEYKSDLNEIRKMYDEGRIQDAQQRLQETAQKNKDDAQRQSEILDLKRQLVDVAKQNADTRANAAGGNGGMTAPESREFTTRTRSIQRQMDALDREKAEYTKMQAQAMLSGVNLPGTAAVQKHLQDLDGKREGLQKQIDDIETEILSRGQKGGAGNTQTSGKTAFSVPAGAPKPTKANDYLKDRGKSIAYSADGKTWGPLPATKKTE